MSTQEQIRSFAARIERLVAGPYCELFARAPVNGWDVWGNQTTKFAEVA